MPFIITQLSVYNYNSTNKGLMGTVTFKESNTNAELKVDLTEEDAVRIFEVFGDRIAATMQTAAMSMLADISARVEPALTRPEKPVFRQEPGPDDDIPF